MHNSVVVNDGIGDGLRAAAALWRRCMTGVRVAVAPSPGGVAAQVFELLSFVESVEQAPVGAYMQSDLHRRALADPEAWCGAWRVARELWNPFTREMRGLTLPLDAFREDWDPRSIVRWLPQYTVVQPATSSFKSRMLTLTLPAGRSYVLLGSEADAAVAVRMERQTASDDTSLLDLRGKITIREALAWVYQAEAVIGVESWAVIAGALFGKPVIQEIDERAWLDLAPTWHVLFPTMGFRLRNSFGG